MDAQIESTVSKPQRQQNGRIRGFTSPFQGGDAGPNNRTWGLRKEPGNYQCKVEERAIGQERVYRRGEAKKQMKDFNTRFSNLGRTGSREELNINSLHLNNSLKIVCNIPELAHPLCPTVVSRIGFDSVATNSIYDLMNDWGVWTSESL
ncbi:hypothetical protein TNIN_459191 [Trichonephila inaurata madagascariensis]|uniref:Uncharacterized protein n=1 Tax=Trichonephila inaurata madagascariensis TaxID=2747483 RepID=A0A8X7CMP3_9ARAC|nr:hypothetical protein TNIN_459191 [Trichonephila inaurata madagascariensis]